MLSFVFPYESSTLLGKTNKKKDYIKTKIRHQLIQNYEGRLEDNLQRSKEQKNIQPL